MEDEPGGTRPLVSATFMFAEGIIGDRPLIEGTDGADGVFGTAADEAFEMFAGDDVVRAGGGDDVFLDAELDAATDRYDGGPGSDLLRLDARRAEVLVDLGEDGGVTVARGAGTDLLTSVETLALDDGRYLFDESGPQAGLAYRLYAAAFARTPDEDGFRFWTDVLEEGTNPANVADRFATSDEFFQRYGTDPNPQGYVTTLYINVLDRLPDGAGLRYWSALIDGGTLDRGDVLLSFAQSAENRENTAADTEDGFWIV